MDHRDFQHAAPAFRTFCGAGSLRSLPRELDRVGARRTVIFCGASMRRQHADALERVQDAVGSRLVAVFDGVQAQSPLPSVRTGASVVRDTRADAVIAVGGGSAVVTARACIILVAEQADIRELCTRRMPDGRLQSPRLTAPKIPSWIVPTTPTTAYAKAGAAVRDPDTHERLALFDPKARAQGVFLDPILASTAPDALVRGAALDAFAMAVEALQSNFSDPLAEALLAHSLHMLAARLPRFHSSPHDSGERLELMVAALLAGEGSDHAGGGLAQALGHATGPRSSTSNGVVEAMFLPHAMRFNARATAAGLARVRQALGETTIDDLLRAIQIPRRLRDAGVTRDVLDEVAEQAMADWALTRSPLPATLHDVRAILKQAW